jgi:Cu+-exporting ATPase
VRASRHGSGHCTATVDEALRAVAGVTEVKVDLEGKSATITGTAGVAALMAAVEATGKEVQHASGGVHAGTEAAGALSAATDSAAPADGSKTPTRGRAGALTPSSGKLSGSAKVIPGSPMARVKNADTPFRTGDSPVMSRLSDLTSSLIGGTKDESVLLSINGMTCAACVAAVERSLTSLSGVREVSISLMGKRGQVFFKPDAVQPEQLIAAINNIGFKAEELKSDSEPSNNSFSAEADYYRGQFWGSVPFSATAVTFSKILPHLGNQRILSVIERDVIPGLSVEIIVVFLCVTPVQFGFGLPFYRRAYTALKHGSANMDVLVVLGTTVAYIYSVFFTLLSIHTGGTVGRNNACFETSAMLISFMLLGKYLETSAKGKASEAVSKLLTLQPPTALRVEGGEGGMGSSEVVSEVAASSLVPGDVVKVVPGATIPADGVVVQGSSDVNESMITGEPVPVPKGMHDNTVGGSVNGNGVLWVKVGAVGANSVLSKIMKLVSDAQMRKPKVQAHADRVAAYFVPTVVAISILTWISWGLALSWGIVGPGLVAASGLPDGQTMAFMFGAATLVIACPCALGLATPTAVMVGSGVGAQLGILFKGGDVLENAASINAVIFDKTGTLTKGALEVVLVATWSKDMTHDELIQVAATAEAHSEHPIGQAVVSAARSRGLKLKAVRGFEITSGSGLSCYIDDQAVLLGNRSWLDQHSVVKSTAQEAQAVDRESRGETVIFIAVGGVLAGMLALSDIIRAESAPVCQQMMKMGIEVWMVTGDNSRTAQHVAKQLGITNVLADTKPKGKKEQVLALQQAGKIVAMVGDGINDAPALAQADVGIAVGSGTDVAIETAHIVLMKSTLRDVATAIDLAKVVMARIRLNFFWAICYNVVGMPLAAGLFFPSFHMLVPPMFAGAAMALSSVSVVCSSLLLRCYRPPQMPREDAALARRGGQIQLQMV